MYPDARTRHATERGRQRRAARRSRAATVGGVNAEDEPTWRGELASALRAERARQRMRQDDVAAAMGWVSRSIVAEVESGRRKLTAWELAQLCQVLDVGIGDLVRGPVAEAVLAALRVAPSKG